MRDEREPNQGRCPKSGRTIAMKGNAANGAKARWMAPLGGAAALAWFLVRVIPKPSRAAYPCQRAAMPAAAGFVVWALGTVGALRALRAAQAQLGLARVMVALGCLGLAAVAGVIGYLNMPAMTAGALFVPAEGPNQPIGTAFGVKPGRVVWVHDPAAAAWDGTGHWWEDRFTRPEAVEAMLEKSIRAAADAPTAAEAWRRLFADFNKRHGRGETGYKPGEKIAIKVNLNQCKGHGDEGNASYNAPQLVAALVGQLVREAGVPASAITVYDAVRGVPSTIYDRCAKAWPGVHFVDWSGGDGREQYARDWVGVHWSQELKGGVPAYLPTCVTQARYLINLAQLRGHVLAGVTLCAKNHFGSLCSDDREGKPSVNSADYAGTHPYVDVHGRKARGMGSYNPLVDLMGHKDLGGKTLLFIIDGLYAAEHQNAALTTEDRFVSEPFGGGWPASILVSQDGVAIDSVATDILRNEPSQGQVTGAVDNYLHEAALAERPPSKTFYDPEGDGAPLGSLGVHEHWNNAKEMQYSRNLGRGEGIELVRP